MDLLTPTREIALLLVTGTITCLLLYKYRDKLIFSKRSNGIDFSSTIGFARQDGYNSVALLLKNKSGTHVWAEEIEISLRDLDADQQTSEASCREVREIKQSVGPRDLLPISLVETIYNAAGRPQRNYSFVLSSVVRFRVGEKWFEEQLPAYRIKMLGLTVGGLRRERKSAGNRTKENLRELSPTSAHSK